MVANTADVVVVGAGPAGTAAAITLARAGRDVILLDKARFPRDKCCGDGLTTGALRRLEALGLDPKEVPSWEVIPRALVRTPDGFCTDMPLPSDGQFVAAATRSDLDAALVGVARRAGVRIMEGIGATGADTDPRAGVRLTLGDGTSLRAWYGVAADGMWSPLRKAVGAGEPGYLGEWHAARRYFERTGPGAREMWVWFEPDLLPGYAWSFPLPGDRANVGYGIVRSGQPAGSAAAVLDDLLRRPHIASVLGPGAQPAGPLRAWPIPAGISEAFLSALSGRILFAGDAARAADPMTGEGIAQALETGELAARAMLRAGATDPGRAAGVYARHVRTGLGMDDRLARYLSGVLAHQRGANGSVRIAARLGWGRRNFARWMFEDYPRAIVATPHRWRLGSRRHGAFARSRQ